MAYAVGSEGVVEFDINTGEVLFLDGSFGNCPVVINVWEYKERIGDIPEQLDLEDIGYILEDGTYEPPLVDEVAVVEIKKTWVEMLWEWINRKLEERVWEFE